MQFITGKEFAAALGVSNRTIQDWRISRDGKPPRLPADHIDERGRAVYTEAQLEIARALLNRNQKTATTEPPEDKPVEPAETAADIPPVPEPATIAADAQIITLEQRADKIRKLQADIQRGIIEIGFELIEAKKEIGHGNWSQWLETEFTWTQQTANRFMRVALRFGNGKLNNVVQFQPSTLQAMLALPEGDEQDFIDAQADAGKPVSEQSAREIQRNVKEWNDQRKPKNPPVKEQTHVEEPTAAQVDDNAGKLIIGEKPLDSCRGFVCINETTDETPDRPDDDDDLRKARAIVQLALAAVSAAIEKNDDPQALEAAAQSLHAIRAVLEAKRKDACLEFRREV